jgi:hypothetical protein
MLYREAGQFKSTYAEDQQIFPIRQDRIGIALLLVLRLRVVPLVGDQYWLSAIVTAVPSSFAARRARTEILTRATPGQLRSAPPRSWRWARY